MTLTEVPAGSTTIPTGHAEAAVDPGFEQRIIDATEPLAAYYLAASLHHFFALGLYDELAGAAGPVPIDTLTSALGLDPTRLRGFLHFLANNAVVSVDGESATLTAKGRLYGEARGWYTMMIGGYGSTLQLVGDALRAGAPPILTRDGRYVGQGSCEVSRYDGMPILRTLLDRAGVTCREVLDLGCGDGLYLVDLCRHLPGIRAWGAEPSAGGYREAVALVERSGLGDAISLRNCSAGEFLANPPADCDPNVIIFGFVLHEILEQEGTAAVRDLLQGVITRFPDINIVVIEVPALIDEPQLMRHGLAHNFWNPYFLVHVVTAQRLERRPFWEELFASAGLRVADLVTTDPSVDSTGLELGYLLKAADTSSVAGIS